jgi:hypothetical protein
MDVDGIIMLSDASVREAEAQAGIAKTLAEAGVIWQQALHKYFENVALAVNIKWDDQAHTNLLKQRNIGLQREKELRDRASKLGRKLQAMRSLLSGGTGSIEAVQQGWLGFYFMLGNVPASVFTKAHREVKPDEDTFNNDSWRHPFRGAAVVSIPAGKDVNLLFQWAARNNYLPKTGWGSWEYLSKFIETVNAGAMEAAQSIDKKLEAAHAAALELSKLDWKRLDNPAGLGGSQWTDVLFWK